MSFAAARAGGANGALIVWGFQQHSYPAQKSPLSYAQTHKTLTSSLLGAFSLAVRKLLKCFLIVIWSSVVVVYLVAIGFTVYEYTVHSLK